MMRTEKKCRKLYRGAYEFSPEVKGWIEKGRAIQELLRYMQTGAGNGGNAKRVARRAGLKDLGSISNGRLAEMAQDCKKKSKYFLAESPWLRWQFLAAQLQALVEDNNIRKANDVKAIIRAESQQKGWNAIKKGMGQNRTPAPTMTEMINAESKQVQCTTQESVEAAIHGKTSPRFSRAGSALIFNGPLFELLGYNADTEAGAEIIEGTFEPLPGTDPTTIIILKEIARILRLMGDGEVRLIITKEDFQHY